MQLRGCLGLALKPRHHGRVRIHLRRQYLERNFPVELDVDRAIYRTHPAGADPVYDAIASKLDLRLRPGPCRFY
jgi:hypothetical protein